MSDPAIAQARTDAQQRAAAGQGLAGTSLTLNLGGQGGGAKKLAGAA